MRLLVRFYANVSEHTVNDLIHWTTQQLAQHQGSNAPQEIIIEISSPGGSSDHGLLAYNYLSQINIPKTTIGMGNVDSAAALLFAAGNKRLATESCRFLLHEATVTPKGDFNASKLSELAHLAARINSDYSDVIKRVTGSRRIGSKIKKGFIMTPTQARNEGLVTTVINTPYLKSLKDLQIILIKNPVQPQQQLPRTGNQTEL